MASASTVLSEDQFRCSVCLDVFTQPVTIPCGHNFCKGCIGLYWRHSSDPCHCPLCNARFPAKPELRVNTFVSEMVEQFRSAGSRGPRDQRPAGPGDVPCDVCPKRKIKALKSCLECLTSYCQAHLEPHQVAPALKRHKLLDPVENLEDRVCKKHQKVLELFCRDERVCVCRFCAETDHKGHRCVPFARECEERKARLLAEARQARELLRVRREKIRNVKMSAAHHKTKAEKEMADSRQVFTALVGSVERSQTEFVVEITTRQKAAERDAERLVRDLEQEVAELKRRCAELQCLANTKDHLRLLQTPPSSRLPLSPEDRPKSHTLREACAAPMMRAMAQMKTAMRKMEDLCDSELHRLRRHAVDVTLDPDTAHPDLALTEDGKQARWTLVGRPVPDNPERFDRCLCVLGKEGFSSGRFYYEVEMKEATGWRLGVARESIQRKGDFKPGPENGLWSVRTTAPAPTLLTPSQVPQKVGVFVDYEEGHVSFYNVEAKSLIHSFNGCRFSERLRPFFSPLGGRVGNVNPLLITPLPHTENKPDV